MRFGWDQFRALRSKAWSWTGIQTFTSLVATTADINGGTVTDVVLTANFDEIVQAASDTLEVGELRGQQITNFGQGAADNLQGLPTAAEGMSARFICATAQAANYFRVQADTNDKIYWNGTAGADNGYVTIAVPTVAAFFDIWSFQTAAGVWDWWAEVGFGNWAAGGP